MMKRVLFILSFLSIAVTGMAQKVELTAGLSGNLYNYSGNFSRYQLDHYSSIAADYVDFPPYSKTQTEGYGANLRLQYIHKLGFIAGVGLGYDVVRNKIYTTSTYISNPSATPPSGGYPPDATGYTLTSLKQLNVNPYIGYRLPISKFSVDLQLGAEVAFNVENKKREVLTGKFERDETYYYPNKKAFNNGQDYRLKGGIAINYHRFCINFNYAHSVSNFYKEGSFFDSSVKTSLYSQLIKIGVNYRIF